MIHWEMSKVCWSPRGNAQLSHGSSTRQLSISGWLHEPIDGFSAQPGPPNGLFGADTLNQTSYTWTNGWEMVQTEQTPKATRGTHTTQGRCILP
jgi:hypothetical protein